MKFDILDARMRQWETTHDWRVPPGMFIIARVDGRGFTRLTAQHFKHTEPFSDEFHGHMTATLTHLMDCGFRVVYGTTHSDEISLLIHPDETLFNRKVRKYDSILAGEASAAFSLRLGSVACFDCRIAPLPNAELVVDYFRWRQTDAGRNALQEHCFWQLCRHGHTPEAAAATLRGINPDELTALLGTYSVDFDQLPLWQTRGVGIYWETVSRPGINPKTNTAVTATRRQLQLVVQLPDRDAYGAFLRQRLQLS